MAIPHIEFLDQVAASAPVENASSELRSTLSKEACCPEGTWPAKIRLRLGFGDHFGTVPRNIQEGPGPGVWSADVLLEQVLWSRSDNAERTRVLKAIALEVLIWLAYKTGADESRLATIRRTTGPLEILGGSYKSAAHKAWLREIRKNQPSDEEDPDSWDNPKNAHRNARSLLKSEWIWDICDEQSPFGNDDGWEMMEELCGWLEENPRKQPLVYFREIIDSYPQPTSWNSVREDELAEIKKRDYGSLLRRDNNVIAFAFGLLVKRGKIPAEIRLHAVGACNRQLLPVLQDSSWPRERAEELISILDSAPEA